MVNKKDFVDVVKAEVESDSPHSDAPGYKGPERRKAALDRLAWEAEMHEENTTKFNGIENRLERLEGSIGDLLALMHGMKTGIRWGIALSRFAKWLMPLLGVFGVFWGLFHGGNKVP